MTSSWLLSKRKEMGDTWVFGDQSDPLGGWEDHYIINGAMRECGANYKAIPIGNPYGFMVCVKRRGESGRYLDVQQSNIDPSQFNGYHRYSADMYRPWRKTQIQTSDPYNYYNRTTPNEAYLHREDYLARDIQYNANGIKPMHTPSGTNERYNEYGYSYTPNPPYKYDISRLHQSYPVWKDDKRYHGASQASLDHIDETFHDRKKLN